MARISDSGGEESKYALWFSGALGRTIKVIRTDLGVERRELAAKAGISYSYLTEIENGNKPPSSSVLAPIASALGLRMSQLIDAAEARMERQNVAAWSEGASAAGAPDAAYGGPGGTGSRAAGDDTSGRRGPADAGSDRGRSRLGPCPECRPPDLPHAARGEGVAS